MGKFRQFLLESYDSPAEFLSDPKNKNVSYSDLLDDFKQNGGEILGGGKYAEVFGHPSWRYVIKLFPRDDCYLKFIRKAYKLNSDSFPKFYGLPKQIYPMFKRAPEKISLYVARLEKLYPVEKNEENNRRMMSIQDLTNIFRSFYYEQSLSPEQRDERGTDWLVKKYKKDIQDAYEEHPENAKLADDLAKVDIDCGFDFHLGNIMQRENGEWVLIDPFWIPPSFWEQHDAVQAAERGYWSDEIYADERNPEDDYVSGGRPKIGYAKRNAKRAKERLNIRKKREAEKLQKEREESADYDIPF